jgi:hypothetical protein
MNATLSRLKEKTKRDLFQALKQNRLSEYLPFRVFDEKDQTYYNMDGTQGWILECTPLAYAGKETFQRLQDLFAVDFQENSILQFILYNTRLFVALKMPMTETPREPALGTRDTIFNILEHTHLKPRYIDPDTLINLMSGILNDTSNEIPYDTAKTINKQIIHPKTSITTHWDKITIGQKHLKCQTVNRMAIHINEMTYRFLINDNQSYGDSTNTEIITTTNIIFRDNAPQTVRIQPIIWSIARSEEESKETSARIKHVLDERGFIIQDDRGILNTLFIAALPLGLTTEEETIELMDRDFICRFESAVNCLPIQCGHVKEDAPQTYYWVTPDADNRDIEYIETIRKAV